jgi:hypothetical protein
MTTTIYRNHATAHIGRHPRRLQVMALLRCENLVFYVTPSLVQTATLRIDTFPILLPLVQWAYWPI